MFKLFTLIFLSSLSFSLLAQNKVPSLIHSGKIAKENKEALAQEVTKQRTLIMCRFDADNTPYQLKIKLRKMQGISIDIIRDDTGYWGDFFSIPTLVLNAQRKTYTSIMFQNILDELIEDFLKTGYGQFETTLNKDNTKWFDNWSEAKNPYVHIQLYAKATKRAGFNKCMANIGCGLQEMGNLTSQSWRYLLGSETPAEYFLRLGLLKYNNAVQVDNAAQYDEQLEGVITLGETDYDLFCYDNFLPHYFSVEEEN